MRSSIIMKPFTQLVALLSLLSSTVSATRLIESSSLNPCQENSLLKATLFQVTFTPDNRSLAFTIAGFSEISDKVTATMVVTAYGYEALRQTLNPCEQKGLEGLCHLKPGPLPELSSNLPISQDVINQIPSLAYTVPDLDMKVQVYINSSTSQKSLACVEAELSNGQTVYQPAVGWVTAIIAGIGLVASAITSGLGHSNTAAHVAANALSLFGYFQAQAQAGMLAVELPPIVASWTQNFQWSMGIIRIGFLQSMATWYQRATGGKPSTLLSNLAEASVEVQKRSLDVFKRQIPRSIDFLSKRQDDGAGTTSKTKVVIVRGIERVGFRAGIEITNIFFTGYIFFVIFVLFVALGVLAFKFICEGLVKSGKMSGDKFQEFRNGWQTVLKGILFRIVLIGFPQMVVLCFWELTKRDSAGEVVLAIGTLLTMLGILGWAASKVIRIAKRSITMHKNPAYILYSDPIALNKWGFLYVQFKATAYFFVVPMLAYMLIKGLFIGLSQKSGVVQAVSIVLIEAALLVGVSVLRPYMDKKTNGFNIAIAAVNFLSSIFLLIFSKVFNQPGIVTGVVGVIFFAVNAVFALILLIMVLVSSVYALVSKNPDTRYQPMRDDRGSFIKSQTTLNAELDALGATARGEQKGGPGFDNGAYDPHGQSDSASLSSVSASGANKESRPVPLANSPLPSRGPYGQEPPRSPMDPSIPFFPSAGGPDGRHGPPSLRSGNSGRASPAPGGGYGGGGMWQRGAGYDH